MLVKYYPNILEERYKTKETDLDKLYLHIGKIRGCLVKGGEVDIEKVHTVVISDVKNGIIKNITFDKLTELLPSTDFCRINKKVILSIKAVQVFSFDEITTNLISDQGKSIKISLSENYRNEFLQKVKI
jgi:hypothetical protein